jgi:aryl-alcohol dehydrogenase-like predicted oxidoreductase
MNDRIVLGTVQFGLDYGINNKSGKPTSEEVYQVLELCYENGIRTLDTAFAYGDSEKRIGKYQSESGRYFEIISKLPECNKEDVKRIFDESLKRLNTDTLYGYLFHNVNSVLSNTGVYEEVVKIKQGGKIKKLGFSLYNTEELETLFEKEIEFNIVQVPFNIFDRRFEKYFDVLSDRKIEIHTRSAYLQGLFFTDSNELDDYFSGVKEKINFIQDLSYKSGISVQELCLSFVLARNKIDKVITGVDGIKQCTELIAAVSGMQRDAEYLRELDKLEVKDINILLPYKWKR